MSASGRRLVSLVVPVYWNEANVPVTWRAIRDALGALRVAGASLV